MANKENNKQKSLEQKGRKEEMQSQNLSKEFFQEMEKGGQTMTNRLEQDLNGTENTEPGKDKQLLV